MNIGRSVQFQNIDNVVNAYSMRNVPAFSILQGKQLLLKYEGQQLEEGSILLSQFLEMLQDSAAIYTLCVYEEYNGKINDRTPYHGSWNFKFQQDTKGYNEKGEVLKGINEKLNQLSGKIEEINRQQLEDDLNNEDPVLDGMDKIGAVLGHPVVQQFLPLLLNALKISMPNDPAIPGKQIAGITDIEKPITPDLVAAVNAMLEAAPESKQSLLKLGAIAQQDPDKFKGLLKYLSFV